VIRLAVRVRRADAEIVLAELLSLAPAGVEETDLGADVVEYAVYGAPGELPALPDVRAAAGNALVEVATTEVADDWAERWREFHRPVTVGGRLHVRAPWHPPAPAGTHDVVVDPGQAFGTGAHPTTRLCLELLQQVSAEGPFADWGCGTGVLAIAAARLGWGPVTALELDPDAAAVIAANARANGVEVEVRAPFDLLAEQPPWAPTVLANLTPVLHREVAARIEQSPERLIAAGFLARHADDVAPLYAPLGEADRAVEGEWAAVSLA